MNTRDLEVNLNLGNDNLDDDELECLCSNWLSLMTKLTYLKLELWIKFGSE